MAVGSTSGEDVIIHIGADTSQISAGYEKAGKATTKFAEQTERRLKALNKIKTIPAVTVIDRTSKPLETIKRKLKLIDKIKAIPTVQIKDRITTPLKTISGELDRFKSKAVGVFNIFRNPMPILAGAAGAFGIMELTQKSAEAGENLYQLSAKLHLSGQEAANLNKILSLSDVNAKTFTSTIMRLDKSVETAGAKGNNTTKALAQFGVQLTDGHGKALKYTDQLSNLAKGYQKAAAAGREEDFAAQVLGTRAQDLIPVLQDYADNAAIAAKVHAIGIDPKKAHEQYLDMKALQMETSQLGMAFSSAILPFTTALAPVFLKTFSRLADEVKSHSKQIQQMTGGMGKRVADDVGKMADSFFSWTDKLSKNKKFQNMSFGDKIIYLTEEALDAVQNYISGPGGKKVAGIFERLGKIAATAWWKGITFTGSNTVKDLAHGDFASAAANGYLFTTLGGVTALGLGYKTLKGTINAGKWTSKNVPKATSAAKKAASGENLWEAKTGNGRVLETEPSKVVKMSKAKAPKMPAEVVKESENTVKEVGKFNKAARNFGRFGEAAKTGLKIGGRVATVAAVGIDAYDFVKSKDKVKTGAKIAGGWSSAAAGAAIGTAIAPGIGTAIGGALGYAIGSWGTGKLVDKVRQANAANKVQNGSLNANQYLNKNVATPFTNTVNRSTSWGRNLIKNFMRGRDSAGMSMAGWLNSKIYIPFASIVSRSTSWGRTLMNNFVRGMHQVSIPAPSIGMPGALISATKHAAGGIFNRPHLGLVAEGGYSEAVIPLNRSNRSLSLYNETGKQLGVNSSSHSSAVINLYMDGAVKAQVISNNGNIEEIAHRAGEIVVQKITAELANLA